MAWPNPFRRTTENTRTCWGYTFDLTSDHPTEEQLHPLKYTYDILADECLERLEELCPPDTKQSQPPPRSQSQPQSPSSTSQDTPIAPTPRPAPRRDFYALLKANHDRDPKLHELWTQLTTVPSWVDWAQIERGQDVLYRYSGAALTGLTFQSLVGGFGANRIVETLVRTGGLSPSAARRRLLQTLQHILQCTRHPDALRPPGSWKESASDVTVEPSLEIQESGESGEGFVATVRVRLLHASVRRRILRLEREKPGYFDIEGWGIPVCDLDCAATVASFSSSVLWLSLPRQGIWPKEQEIVDYVALWRYIGYLLGYPSKTAVARYESFTKQKEKNFGDTTMPCRDIFSATGVASTADQSVIDPDFFASPKRAKAIFESLLIYEVEPSATSRLLARNILVSLANQPPVHVSVSMLAATTRWLIGGQLANALDVPIPSPYLYYSALAIGQCCFFAGMTLLDRTYMALSRYWYRLAVMWRSRLRKTNKKVYETEKSKYDGNKSSPGANAEVLADGDTAEIEAAVQSGQTGYWFGQTKIKRLKVFLWTFVVQSKAGLAGKPTKFDFEFVPKVTAVRAASVTAVPEHPSYDICVGENAATADEDEDQARLLENDVDDRNHSNDKIEKGVRQSINTTIESRPNPNNLHRYHERRLQSRNRNKDNDTYSNTVNHGRRIEYRNLRALLIALVLTVPLAAGLTWYLGRWAWGAVLLLTGREVTIGGGGGIAAAAVGAVIDVTGIAITAAVDILSGKISTLTSLTVKTTESAVLETLELLESTVAFFDAVGRAVAAGLAAFGGFVVAGLASRVCI